MSTFALSRATFLTFVFPKIIKYGRIWHSKRYTRVAKKSEIKQLDYGTVNEAVASSSSSSSNTDVTEVASLTNANEQQQPSNLKDIGTTIVGKDALQHAPHERAFDLIFLRWSIFLDACLTSCLTSHSKPWHMYAGELVAKKVQSSSIV